MILHPDSAIAMHERFCNTWQIAKCFGVGDGIRASLSRRCGMSAKVQTGFGSHSVHPGTYGTKVKY